jgi:hypothetical protein
MKISDGFNPEVLLYGEESSRHELGLNVSGPIGDSVVAFGEYATGKDRSLLERLRGDLVPLRTQRRGAIGFTYTAPINLSFTAEIDYNSAAPNAQDWQALGRSGSNEQYRLIAAVGGLQDLPVRRAAFFYFTWKDALVRRLNLSSFVRTEANTRSKIQWIEARYQWDNVDLAAQWLHYSGNPGSVYRAIPQRSALEIALRMYFN